MISTTNTIDGLNSVLRKYTKSKKMCPNDDSALKSILLATHHYCFLMLIICTNWLIQHHLRDAMIALKSHHCNKHLDLTVFCNDCCKTQ
ncbi:MAG: hypothetical protein GXZ03_04340 [Proteiniphilum sp.]|nr:hypothetical protein [Proteiniphilum sp.]